MKKEKLITNMWIFTVLLIFVFTSIVINEKKYAIISPKVKEKLVTYAEENYKNIYKDFSYGKIKYNIGKENYQLKVINKNNKHLYFYLIYNHNSKKISSTYKNDYVEGKSLLNFYKKRFEKSLNKNSRNKHYVSFNKKLNEYDTIVEEKLLEDKDISSLKIITVKTSIRIDTFDEKEITSNITKEYNSINKKGITPRLYSFEILFDDELKSFLVENLTEEIIKNNTNEIIRAIMVNDNSIVNKYNIKFKYLN